MECFRVYSVSTNDLMATSKVAVQCTGDTFFGTVNKQAHRDLFVAAKFLNKVALALLQPSLFQLLRSFDRAWPGLFAGFDINVSRHCTVPMIISELSSSLWFFYFATLVEMAVPKTSFFSSTKKVLGPRILLPVPATPLKQLPQHFKHQQTRGIFGLVAVSLTLVKGCAF